MPVDIPFLGARTVIWVIAELHLFFGAFVLGAPIFVVLFEYLGVRRRDPRFERMAVETMRVVVLAYPITAALGVMFAFMLMGPFQSATNYLVQRFFPVFGLYGVLILVETVIVYVYWYSWGPLRDRRGLHIGLGVALNLVGTALLMLMNAVGSFMLTPPEGVQDAGLWEIVNNPSWSGLNLHRFIANITFGGFIVALFAAYKYLSAKRDEDRAFYDWMGFMGNFIGVGTLMLLPVAGYIYAKELFLYDASISTLLMADKLSWFFEIQGVLVSVLFLLANYYMWLSIKRISGGARFAGYMKFVFIVILVASAIWITPQSFLPDLTTELGDTFGIADVSIPQRLAFLGLMATKALAVTAIILVTFVTYLVYRRALRTGTIVWGRIDPRAQLVLVALPAVIVFTMGLMGAIREFARQDYHVYLVLKDTTPYWFMPTLGYTSIVTGVTTLLFFSLIAVVFAIGTLSAHAPGRATPRAQMLESTG